MNQPEDSRSEFSGQADELATERAKVEARRMLAGLMPGDTGKFMADEIAENVIKAYLGKL